MSWLVLLRWELAKIARRRGSYVAFVLCVVFCAMLMLAFGYSQFRALSRHAGRLGVDPLSYVNGYLFSSFALYFGDKALLPLLAVLAAGSQIAGEAKEGTLRVLLSRPPSRPAVFAAKTLVSYLWVLGIVCFLMFFALLAGLIALGGGDFLVFVWEFRWETPWVAPPGAWLPMFLASCVGVSLSLMVFVSLAMALSAITDNPVVAHAGALGVYFISSVVQRLPEQILDPAVREILPTTHMGFWHELYDWFHQDPSRFNGYRFWTDVTWCTAYSVVFLAVGLIVFMRKDIRS